MVVIVMMIDSEDNDQYDGEYMIRERFLLLGFTRRHSLVSSLSLNFPMCRPRLNFINARLPDNNIIINNP